MNPHINYVVYNPSSLRLLCVCSIRRSISCLGQHVERNLIEKLTAGDLDDLRNPNVPISLEYMCKYLYYIFNFAKKRIDKCFISYNMLFNI